MAASAVTDRAVADRMGHLHLLQQQRPRHGQRRVVGESLRSAAHLRISGFQRGHPAVGSRRMRVCNGHGHVEWVG